MSATWPAVRIEIVEVIDQDLVDSLRRLYSQLYPDSPQDQTESIVGPETLSNLIGSPTDVLLVVKTLTGRIIGTATLNLIYRVHGCFAQIETFVIDQADRGQGLGQLLVDKLIELADANQVRIIGLVSGKQRLASHRLYQRNGFSQPDLFYYSRQLNQPRSDEVTPRW